MLQIETPITVEDLSEMGTSARRELVRAVNLHNGLVRALRGLRGAFSEYVGPNTAAADAMLNLAGGIVDITSSQICALCVACRCSLGAARKALIDYDGDPIMAELALRRTAPHWCLTFDDDGFGWWGPDDRCIQRRGAPRPPGFVTNAAWYEYAKSVIAMVQP